MWRHHLFGGKSTPGNGGELHLDIPVAAPGEKGFYRILIRR
jgi:hypothetical protein